MKIHVFGCSGSGKSFLSDRLSRKYGIPHYDLDDICWDNTKGTYGIKSSEDKRNQMLKNILNQDDWIIEGVYYSWLSESFEKADKIVVLNIPPLLCRFRIIKRFIKRKFGMENGKKETLKSLYNLLRWTDKFCNTNLPEAEKALTIYNEKVIVLSSVNEVNHLISSK